MNNVTIEPTQFVNMRSGNSTLGFRAYDDEDKVYCNVMEVISDDDLEFLEAAREAARGDEGFESMLDFCNENGKGLYIGDVWYEYFKIESIISD